MKPWARYEVGFVNHDKFRAINSNAIVLWLEGKNYADSKHTDGLLPEYEVKHWRFYSKKCVAMLTRSCGTKPGTSQPYAALWEVIPDFGFKMHDYLDHNECREKVEARMEKAEAGREKERKRQKDFRDRQRGADVTPYVTRDIQDQSRAENVSVVSVSVSSAASDDPETEKTIEMQAGKFLDRFCELYREHLHGAHYHLKPSLHWTMVCDLLHTWDVARLEKLAVILLTTDDEWVMKTDRGIGVFQSRASWCDKQLKAWEVEHGVTA